MPKRKLRQEYQNLQDFVDWYSALNAQGLSARFGIEDEELNPKHYSRESVLALMRQVTGFVPKGYDEKGNRQYVKTKDIDSWFWQAYHVTKSIEWLNDTWQCQTVIRKLLNDTPEDVKFLPDRHLGFESLFDV